jgi:uncharacterized protein
VVDPFEAHETARGLQVHGRLDVGHNETARQVHRLVASRSLKQFSFGYRVPRGGERRARDRAKELTEVHLIEVGPCLRGANAETELLGVKSLDSAADRHLRDKARDEMLKVLLGAGTTTATSARDATGPIRVASFDC